MPETSYTYDVTTETANGRVNSDDLLSEILASSIVIAPERIDVVNGSSLVNGVIIGGSMDVVMKDTITKADLDVVVLAHQGENIPQADIVQVEGIGATSADTGAPRVEVWSDVSMPQTLGSSFETIWSKAGPGQFFRALFGVSSDRIYMRVTADGETLVDVYLDDLHDDFGLNAGNSEDSGSYSIPGSIFGLREVESKRWLYEPEVPIRFNTEIRFEFRRSSGNRRIEAGICSWGPL